MEVHEVVELVDIMPTVFEYLEVESPRSIRGRPWPLIHGQIEPERIAITEHGAQSRRASLGPLQVHPPLALEAASAILSI